MEKQSILICLEGLGSGGVETAVLSQTKAFLAQGHRVIVLAKNGIYKEKLEQLGALHIEFEFPLENNYQLEKAQEIVNIIKREHITQVHIEQFPCVLSAFPACQMAGVPYVAYLHVAPQVREEIFQWFFQQFDIYQIALPSFFKNADKIVSITQSNIEYHQSLFHLSKEKYVVKYNSIDFEQYPYQEKENEKKNFLLPSRLSVEKLVAIQNGIDIFASYLKKQDSFLRIAGDGNQREVIEEYIKEKGIPSDKVEFLGNRQDIPECMAQSDIVLGVDRVILEAIACKRLAIITGYDACKGIVLPENMEKIQEENFSGYNLESILPEKIADSLFSLDSEGMNKIIEGCYQFAREKCSIHNNIYVIPNEKEIGYETSEALFEETIKLEEKNQEARQEKKELEKRIEEKEETISSLKKETIQLRQELDAIYNSRRWKYASKVAKLFKK